MVLYVCFSFHFYSLARDIIWVTELSVNNRAAASIFDRNISYKAYFNFVITH